MQFCFCITAFIVLHFRQKYALHYEEEENGDAPQEKKMAVYNGILHSGTCARNCAKNIVKLLYTES
jgi:hypothetical protein